MAESRRLTDKTARQTRRGKRANSPCLPDAKRPSLPEKTVGQAIEQFKARLLPELTDATRRSYLRILDGHIAPVIGSQLLSEVTPSDVKAIMARVESDSSANNHRSVLSSLYKFAIRQKWYQGASPTAKVSARSVPRVHQPLTASEVTAVWAELDKLKRCRPLHVAVVKLLMLTGANHDEIVLLQWSEVDPFHRVLRKRATRIGKSPSGMATNIIPLPPLAWSIIEALPRRSGDSPVFPAASRDGKKITITGLWRHVLVSAGVEPRVIRHLRHTLAYLMAEAGCSLDEIGTVLRQAYWKATEAYAHLLQAQPPPGNVLSNQIIDEMIWGNLEAYNLRSNNLA